MTTATRNAEEPRRLTREEYEDILEFARRRSLTGGEIRNLAFTFDQGYAPNLDEWAWFDILQEGEPKRDGFHPTQNLAQALACVMETDVPITLGTRDKPEHMVGVMQTVRAFEVTTKRPSRDPRFDAEIVTLYQGPVVEADIARAIMQTLREQVA